MQNHRLPDALEREKLTTDDSQRQVCSNLTAAIGTAAQEAEIRRLSLTVTPQEVAAYSTIQQKPDAGYAELQKRATHLAEAFAAVIDHGEDSHAVYRKRIQPDRITEDTWLVILDSARNDPATRKRFESPLPVSPTSPNAEYILKYSKLTKEVDQILAAKDPTFRTYLAEFPDPSHWSENGTHHHQYLDQKRNEYWRAVISKLNVWLSDSTLFDKCQLASFGVVAPGKN